MRKLAACLALIATIALAAGPALAGPEQDFDRAIDEARLGLAGRNAVDTLGGLRKAIAAAWRMLPFTAIEVQFTEGLPRGFAQYTPREDNVFEPGEPLFIYLEPVGFTVLQESHTGLYVYDISVDFNLVDSNGRVVGGKRDVGRFRGKSRYFPHRVPLNFTYSLKGLPLGDYHVETILRDNLGKQTHTASLPFKIFKP